MTEQSPAARSFRLPVFALALVACAQILWMIGQYGAERSALLERAALDPSRELTTVLRHETESAQRHLAIVKSQAEVVLKERIRDRVDEAIAVAEAIHAQAAGSMPAAALQSLIRESLRSPRFFSGRGYYFIDSIDGACILLPTVPRLEGTSLLENRDDAGRYIMRELIRAVGTPGDAGYVRYSWYPPNVSDRMDDKIAYARLFKPFNWLIGTGDYISAVEDGLKADALERLRAVRLTRGGRLVVLDQDGVIRLFPDSPTLEGTKISNLANAPETEALQAIWQAGKQGAGATRFAMALNDTGRPQTWLAWAQTEPTFNWVVAAMAEAGEPAADLNKGSWGTGWRFILPIAILLVVTLWAITLLILRGRQRHEP
ncbi:cache domain-containing protein [Magnetospirillum sulfuroxidans]|uniref:Cache domain-containing protein n=1 Tax=Magnetospirillum sulfuroxidans TaxID=611300 RepID=A0ABS5IGM6_9PROT|nr:cache domain-containing protein [Magnetospirillum sulfuroxidans]